MANFTLVPLTHFGTRQLVFKLVREGRCYYEEFLEEIKADANLKPELGDLLPTLKYVANGTKPELPKQRYKRFKLGKKVKYPVYEAKSKNLRLYIFTDNEGMIIILGGKKTEQDEDEGRIEKILKEYYQFKQLNR